MNYFMSKYNSKKVIVDGIEFDSKIESQYYLFLKNRLDNKEIAAFWCQPSYEITPKFIKMGKQIRATHYTPDFLIRHLDGSLEAIDIKGFPDTASELRKKWFDYRYPEIKLTWLSYVKKYGGWIEYDELKKKRKESKKEK